jgi:hypothetical protein
VLYRAGVTEFAIKVVAETTGVSQIIPDRFQEAVIHIGLVFSRQILCDQYQRRPEQRGNKLWEDYQSDA